MTQVSRPQKNSDYGGAAAEAEAYYRLTEEAYRLLDPAGTDFMNLGAWPADSVAGAQGNLYRRVLTEWSARMNGAPKRLLELGSGWAAGREIVAEFWPEVDYWGINSSPKQIAFARKKFENSKSTFFRQARFEDLTHEKLPPCDAVLAVEAMLHVENKSGVINLFNQLGAKTVAFAEICTTNLDRVLENPLFRPSLNYLWSTENYRTTLLASGFAKIEILEIGRDVFSPWSQTLLRIKSESFSGHPRILRQFQSSYRDLSHLFDQGVVSYQLIFASRESF